MPGLKRTRGGAAVMAMRAPEELGDDTPKMRLHRQLNFFPTPPWAARVGAELILSLDPHAHSVWEPAAGDGHMAEPLRYYFDVTASDIYDYGRGYQLLDFLDEHTRDPVIRDQPDGRVDWIVTNPPFSTAGEFVRLGLRRARRGVAVLCRLQFLESGARFDLMHSLAQYAPFSERVAMRLGYWDPELSSATAYAWYLWMRPEAERESPMWPVIRACRDAGGYFSKGIAPGTRNRLWASDDARIYGGENPYTIEEIAFGGGGLSPGGQLTLGTTGGQPEDLGGCDGGGS